MGQEKTNIKGLHFQMDGSTIYLIDCKLYVHHGGNSITADYPQLLEGDTSALVDAAQTSQAAFVSEVGNMPSGWQDVWSTDMNNAEVRTDVWKFFSLQTRPPDP